MKGYGDFDREQRHREMEHAGIDIEESGWEWFVGWMFKGLAMLAGGICIVFLLNWLLHFGRVPN